MAYTFVKSDHAAKPAVRRELPVQQPQPQSEQADNGGTNPPQWTEPPAPEPEKSRALWDHD